MDCYGIVSGNDITSFTVVDGGDQGNSTGDVVEMLPTAAWGQDLADALTTSLTRNGSIATTGVATFTDHIDVTNGKAIRDGNDNEFIKWSQTASAVNEFTITNAATGTAPTLSATGGDPNIDLKIDPKGTTGRVVINGAGAATTATVATSQTTTSATFTDLSTVGPAVTATIGVSGTALVCPYVRASTSTTGGAFMGFVVSGASTVAAASSFAVGTAATTAQRLGATFLVTGLTPGSNTFTAKYLVTTGTGTFEDRALAVVPL
jgi:hypothetical protein